ERTLAATPKQCCIRIALPGRLRRRARGWRWRHPRLVRREAVGKEWHRGVGMRGQLLSKANAVDEHMLFLDVVERSGVAFRPARRIAPPHARGSRFPASRPRPEG